jgi:hypothetical protein
VNLIRETAKVLQQEVKKEIVSPAKNQLEKMVMPIQLLEKKHRVLRKAEKIFPEKRLSKSMINMKLLRWTSTLQVLEQELKPRKSRQLVVMIKNLNTR